MNEMNWMDESCGWQSRRIERLKDMEEAYLGEVEARLKCEAEIERLRVKREDSLSDKEIAADNIESVNPGVVAMLRRSAQEDRTALAQTPDAKKGQ